MTARFAHALPWGTELLDDGARSELNEELTRAREAWREALLERGAGLAARGSQGDGTLACIAGAVAEARQGVPGAIAASARGPGRIAS